MRGQDKKQLGDYRTEEDRDRTGQVTQDRTQQGEEKLKNQYKAKKTRERTGQNRTGQDRSGQ